MAQVKAAQVLFNRDPLHEDEVHMILRDTKGRLWERFTKMRIGDWGRIPLPDEPEPAENHRARRVSKPAR